MAGRINLHIQANTWALVLTSTSRASNRREPTSLGGVQPHKWVQARMTRSPCVERFAGATYYLPTTWHVSKPLPGSSFDTQVVAHVGTPANWATYKNGGIG